MTMECDERARVRRHWINGPQKPVQALAGTHAHRPFRHDDLPGYFNKSFVFTIRVTLQLTRIRVHSKRIRVHNSCNLATNAYPCNIRVLPRLKDRISG